MKKVILILFLLFVFSISGCTNTNKNENIDVIIELIDTLPSIDNVTLDNEELVMDIEYKYSLLTDEEKAKITNFQIFFEVRNKINFLNDFQKETVNEINTLIEDLPKANKITINHKQKLDEIEELLALLTSSYKEVVNDLDKYNQAREKYEQLIREKEAEENAKEIISLINKLPRVQDLKTEDEEKIKDIRNKYDALDEISKEKVDNIDILINLEKVIEVIQNHEGFLVEDIFSCVSDIATVEKDDVLKTKDDKNTYQIEWSSSNEDVYSVIDNSGTIIGKVNKIFQTHQYQKITVIAKVKFNNNEEITLTKEIKVAPIVFEDLPDTPVATYFQTSAMSSYVNYSERYKEEGTLFSQKAKKALNIVYYSFANPTESGTLYLSDLEVLNELRKLRADDIRIVVSIAGVSSASSKIFNNLTSDKSKRAKFVSNIVEFLDKYNFDGVDIDWESAEGAYVVASNMNLLMEDLRKELNKKQASGGTPYLLTAAIPSTSWGAGTDRFDFKTLNKYVDYINMMSYDLNNPDKTTHVSSAYSSSNDKGFGFSCDYGVNLFTSRGLDKNKIILGVAGYGKAYKVTNDTSSSKYPLLGCSAKLTALDGIPGSFASGTVFLNGVEVLIKSGKYKQITEYNSSGKIVGFYLYNEAEKIFVTYDSKEAIIAKYEYAKANEGMGIMCWAYTEDTADSYVNSIYDNLE